MERFDLTNFEESIIEPLLRARCAGFLVSMTHGFWMASSGGVRTGRPWPHTTCVNRIQSMAQSRVTGRALLNTVSAIDDGDRQTIDASSIRVHLHAANGQKEQESRCMVRSRGGLAIGIHVLVDAEGHADASMFERSRPGTSCSLVGPVTAMPCLERFNVSWKHSNHSISLFQSHFMAVK